jgi:WD40 repeat protein
VTRGRLLGTYEGFTEDFLKGSLTQKGAHFATVASTGTILVWDVASRRLQRSIEDRSLAFARRVVLSPDGALLAAVSRAGAVTLWNIGRGERQAELRGHAGLLMELSFSPDGQVLAAASRDCNIWLWRVSDGARLGTLQGHQEAVRSIDFSPEGGCLVSTAHDQSIRFWDVASGRLLRVLKDPHGASRRVRFDPQGRGVVSLSVRGRLALLRAEDGLILSRFTGHFASVRSWAFNPDGMTIAVAYEDGVVGIHEVASGKCLAKLLRLPEGWVALRSDGRFKGAGGTAASFWFTLGLCRFDPDELSSVLSSPWRIPDGEPLLQPSGS